MSGVRDLGFGVGGHGSCLHGDRGCINKTSPPRLLLLVIGSGGAGYLLAMVLHLHHWTCFAVGQKGSFCRKSLDFFGRKRLKNQVVSFSLASLL